MEKSPAVAYYTRKIRSTDRFTLYNEIDNAPLTRKDRHFLYDIIEGLSYKELAVKYCISEAGIYKWKRKTFETMHRFYMRGV